MTGRLRRNSTHGPSGTATSAPTAGPDRGQRRHLRPARQCSTSTAISGNAPNPSPVP